MSDYVGNYRYHHPFVDPDRTFRTRLAEAEEENAELRDGIERLTVAVDAARYENTRLRERIAELEAGTDWRDLVTERTERSVEAITAGRKAAGRTP